MQKDGRATAGERRGNRIQAASVELTGPSLKERRHSKTRSLNTVVWNSGKSSELGTRPGAGNCMALLRSLSFPEIHFPPLQMEKLPPMYSLLCPFRGPRQARLRPQANDTYCRPQGESCVASALPIQVLPVLLCADISEGLGQHVKGHDGGRTWCRGGITLLNILKESIGEKHSVRKISAKLCWAVMKDLLFIAGGLQAKAERSLVGDVLEIWVPERGWTRWFLRPKGALCDVSTSGDVGAKAGVSAGMC